MVPLTSLLLPILLAAVLVFVASSIIHMATPIHRNDVKRLRNEDDVMDALRRFNIAPGDYAVPHAGSSSNMRSPEFIAKITKGPVIFMTVVPNGPPSMATSLGLWFMYCVLVGVFAAYIAGRAVGPGAPYLQVFRFAGAAAFSGYSLALLQNSIWWKRNWGATIKNVLDGVLYGLLTAGVFGWLWPR